MRRLLHNLFLLTFMATFNKLVELGQLVKIEVRLDPDILPQRMIYALPSVIGWLRSDLPALVAEWEEGSQSPIEQVDYRFSQFIAGENISFWQAMHIMRPADGTHHIWELKTKDVRFFGWFYQKDVFVIAQAASTKLVKQNNLYPGMRDVCVQLRERLDLDEPKVVVGGYSDVVSS